MKRVFLPMALMIMGVVSPAVTTDAETLYIDNVSVVEEYTELVLTMCQASPDNPDNPRGPRRAKSRKTIYSAFAKVFRLPGPVLRPGLHCYPGPAYHLFHPGFRRPVRGLRRQDSLLPAPFPVLGLRRHGSLPPAERR